MTIGPIFVDFLNKN